jgi:hypothetical protein
MTDLIQLMSKLTTPKGEILIPGIKDLVAPLTAEEKERYDVMDVSRIVIIPFIHGADLTLCIVLDQRYGRCNRQLDYY